ncbi:MAG: ATP-binding protein [Candidatus Omnitrophota bacterium]
MAPKNPYTIRSTLPIESDMFFGRETEINRSEAMLSLDSPQCLSIIGERRIGKSSLALRIFHDIKELKKTFAFFLDCDGLAGNCNSKDEFFYLLNKRYWDTLKENLRTIDNLEKEHTLFDDYNSFKIFLKQMQSKEIKSIVFLDEFEHLPQNEFANDSFFSNLRSLANKPDNRLAFVTLSRTSLKDLTHQSIKTSGFWNIFKTETIGLLDDKSISRLRRYGFKMYNYALTWYELEKINYYAGNSPFFNQVVCSYLWDSKFYNYSPDWDNLEMEILPYLEKLWDDRTLEEQYLLLMLGHRDVKEDFSLKRMKNRGVIKEENKHFFPFSEFFSKFIESKSETK